MGQAGRPLNPLDPSASAAAKLGADLRAQRLERGLTLQALAAKIGYSPQHISSAELAKSPVSGPFVAACDRALGAGGQLIALMGAVVQEQAARRHAQSIARGGVPVGCATGSPIDAGEDVDPTNRRGLLGVSAAAALGGLGVATAAPAAARDTDPELPAHWTQLLSLLGRHDAMYGPRDVLDIVCHELRLIADHRQVARRQLRTELMCVESRWAQFAAWLSNDSGQVRSRNAWADHALQLAREADYRDMIAFIRLRQSQWAAQDVDARRAIALAEAALRVTGTSAQTRARGALRAAFGHALANDATACERHLAHGEDLMERADCLRVPPWVGRATIRSHVRPDEARCWLWMRPTKAIALYENVLRDWPRERVRDHGLHQARLAVACAQAGELDRAEAEGRKALATTRTTGSAGATRELKRLATALG
jgi:hypothetical protein